MGLRARVHVRVAVALVRDGDRIALSVSKRSIDVLVDEDELVRRRSEWQSPERWQARGWQTLYGDQVMQADKGADLRFLSGVDGDGA